ncbi:TonB-dependent receptor [Aquabacterium sp.]|uniref:TonB-dependent receptor n=1 Tax=Aquabacterium sp. TaxID=1872578 RepID=UPI002CF65F12|nr:TonB-dependent receptor [Aquabacterium sp.]HSW04393.1 TonB-dependent receptor [Aquabacterium sp.]
MNQTTRRTTPHVPPVRKRLSALIQAACVLPALAASAQAQTEPAATTVTVTGIRASVRNALQAKEASNAMVEVIASEDIGKLPDTTIAESLARLPGLSSGLDRGNASQIVARGMGPRFIGALLNGRELASSEPGRAVRFELFPSESVTGAIVHKTQSADLVEGGIATTVDLLTVQPLKYSERLVSLKADALYYPMGRDLPGASSTAPRLGGIYVDQFNGRTLGVALAFSYQDQPSLHKNMRHWGFNEDHSADITGDGQVDKTPWGFQDEVKRGKDKRSSVLAKVEYKPTADALITGDLYYARAAITEPGLQHWTGDLGNWDGWASSKFSGVDVRNGYVVGATVSDVGLTTNDYTWVQTNSNFAGGLNAKLGSGDWKYEADLSASRATRDSQWRDLRQFANSNSTIRWSFTGDERMDYSFGHDSGNPAAFGTPTMHVDNDGHIKDQLKALQLSATRSLDSGDVRRLKFGARVTDREKSYHQTTWSVDALSTVPDSAYETIRVDGFAPFIALRDFNGTATSVFGANVFDATGRTPTQWDQLAGWQVTERSSSLFVQADLDGTLFGLPYRGNAGLRVVHNRQTGAGMQMVNGAAPSPFSAGTSYTEALPSLNIVLGLDDKQEKQLRFGLSRAMSRAPLDEMRGSRNISIDTNPQAPITGSAGNPTLKPMIANQLDLAYQWYFGKGSLLSAGLFYKDLSRYIAITSDHTTIDGREAWITHSVNGKGGYVRGIELVYQTNLPAPLDGFGVHANYAYTDSNVREQTPAGNPFPIEGLMRHNGGMTLWYEKNGFEARLSANHHSSFVRNPTWTTGSLVVNGAETYLTLSLAQQITPQLQLRFGIDNLTNQKVVYTSGNNPYQQEVTEFGRRFNLGVSYKL